MYKIYINETPIWLTEKEQAKALGQSVGNHLIARYAGKAKTLLNYADMLEKGGDFDSIILYSDDLQQLYDDFFNHYLIVEASGGLVFNEKEELLMIFRRGHWDLPKGKIEAGESIEVAAVREVEEETGIHSVQLDRFFQKTYHFYRTRENMRAIKLTHWFLMKAPQQMLTPQTEEDIELAQWSDLNQFDQFAKPIYGNIFDLIKRYQSNKKQN